MKGLTGKNVVITGAASGIGRQVAMRLAEEGVRVHILDINIAGAKETLASLGDQAGKAFAVDISDYNSVTEAITEIHEADGSIHCLVNNAGWDKAIAFMETDPHLWKKVIDINYLGPLHLLHATLPHMTKAGKGMIVNISSDAGRVGSSGEAVYAGCKAGVIALGKSIAREVARKGVCVNTVCPGPTDTALLEDFAGEGEYGQRIRQGLERAIPMKRLGQPEDLAGIVTFLLSDEASFITGQVISVSGGLTMHG